MEWYLQSQFEVAHFCFLSLRGGALCFRPRLVYFGNEYARSSLRR
jgi:hypothetical protein